MSDDKLPASAQELERAVAYYKKRIDELSGENIKGEYRLSGLRKEIKQKRAAFALLSKLQLSFGKTTSIDGILKTTLETIAQSLDIDRAFILVPTETENFYAPLAWQGLERLTDEVIAGFSDLSFEFPSEFAADAGTYLLVTRATVANDLSKLVSEKLDLPFFVCTPVIVENRAIAIIMMGRLKEAGTAFPPLDMGDTETLFSISGLVSAIVQNLRVGVLQEADRLKTEFFANLSHEFRTPITLTLGAIEGIISGRFGVVENPQVLNQADLIKRNQSRLLNLINQILDLEKLESGKESLKVQRVTGFNSYLQKRLDQFFPISSKKNVSLIYSGDERLEKAPLYVDPEKFDRMLFNLLSNAVKFTTQGQIKLEAYLREDHFGIRVVDSGMGIKASQIPHIFDRFRQADGSASREYAGTGIGLALVKQLTELHGGKISVQSKYGTGTTFDIQIPLGTANYPAKDVLDGFYNDVDQGTSATHDYQTHEGKASEEQVQHIHEWNEALAKNIDHTKGKVLYVDDNHDLREYVKDLLKLDFNIFLSFDGRDALEKLSKYNPDLILSDLMMPNMTGEELLTAVKSSDVYRGIPFVLLTAKHGMDSKVTNLVKGADDYLNKPFSEVELKARVHNLIKIRQQQNKIQADLLAARGIQRALLPDLERNGKSATSPVSFDVLYHPCEILSGDFYDVIEHQKFVYFYVADVMSHGTASAQITYIIKTVIQDILSNSPGISAAELLRGLYLRYAAMNLDYSVSIQIGAFDKKSSVMEFVAAGTPPPILRTAESTVAVEPEYGPYLISGYLPNADIKFSPIEIALKEGDSLFVFTDGCFEFEDVQSKQQLTIRKLARLFKMATYDQWQPVVLQELQKAHGSEQFEDDITVLRITRRIGKDV